MINLIADNITKRVYEVFLDENVNSEIVTHNLNTKNVAFVNLEGIIKTEIDNNNVRIKLDKKSKRAHCFVFVWV